MSIVPLGMNMLLFRKICQGDMTRFLSISQTPVAFHKVRSIPGQTSNRRQSAPVANRSADPYPVNEARVRMQDSKNQQRA